MQVFQTFDKELEGLKTYTALFHTKAGKDFEKWNNWNFTSPGIWDGDKDANFWYSPNTTMLYLTVPYILGQQSVQKIDLPLQPESITKVDQIVKSKILGVPIVFGDEQIDQVLWGPTLNMNSDYLVPLQGVYNGTTITTQLNMNFVERRYILSYFTVFDIMSKIGGFRASVMPIVGEFAPFFILFFLVQLSKIIQ
jgi:hypothetical protein